MKKMLIGVIAAFAFVLSGAVFASGDAFTAPAHSYAKTGLVIGANAGYGFLDTPYAYLVTPFVIGANETLSQSRNVGRFVWSAHLGYGFAISPKTVLGMELAYQDLGRSTYSTTYMNGADTYTASRKIYQSAIAVLMTGKYYVWRGLNMFGKFGVAFVRVQTKQKSDSNTFVTPAQRKAWQDAYNVNKVIWRMRPELAAGVGYTFMNNLNVYVMFKHIFANGNEEQWGWGTGVTTTPTNDITRLFVYGSSSVVGGFTYTFPMRT